MSEKKFFELTNHITDRDNGFIIFDVPENIKRKMVEDVFKQDLDRAPPNRLRKIIFRYGSGLTTSEKLSIVGKLLGKGKTITEESIYEVMLDIHDQQKKITITAIAKELNCSTKSVHRNIGDILREEKDMLNLNLNNMKS